MKRLLDALNMCSFFLSLVKTSFMIPQHLQKHIVKLSTDEIYQRCYSLMLSSVSGVGGL